MRIHPLGMLVVVACSNTGGSDRVVEGAGSGAAGAQLGGGRGGGVGGSGGRPANGGSVSSGAPGLSGRGAGGGGVGGHAEIPSAGTSPGGALSSAGGAMSSAGGASGGRNAGGLGGVSAGLGGRSDASAGANDDAGASDDDRCNTAVYDPQKPPAMLALTGNLGAHDPSLIEANGKYYLYATGDGLGAKTSTDLHAWSGAPAVFSTNPAWIAQQVPGATNLWAPDISFFGGQYHLYYAASTFGSNASCIGHATRDALDSGSFADHGSVLCSNASGSSDDFNAIDPNVIVDQAGTPWLAFGSFWSGIKLAKLKTDGTRADATLTALADRSQNGGALEGPFIVRRCGYYYLFVSFGACCGTPWDYNVRVGRSASVTGPYVDKAGTALTQGGGTAVLTGNTTWTAPGHNAVIFTDTGAYNVYHALDASHANPTLRVAELAWDADGWPVSAGP